MSQVDELIGSYCPDGIAFKEIGEISKIQSGGTPSSKNTSYYNGDIHWSAVNDVTSAKMYITSTKKTITKAGLDNSSAKIFPAGTLLLTIYATLGAVAITEKEMATNQAILGILPDETVDVRFLYYVMQNSRELLISQKQAGSQNNLNKGIVSKFKVPVPPLKIQRHIADILDTFNKMESELEAELEARKHQLEHYIDLFLNRTNGDARWMALGDIGRVAMCKRIFKSETTPSGEIPFFKIGTFGSEPDAYITQELYEKYRAKYSFPREGDVLISAAGTIGRTIPYSGEAAYFQDSNIVWLEHDESVVTNSYLRYWYRVVNWSTDGGTIKRLYNENIRRARIAVPSLSEQRRIVDTLDKFDALVNDLSIGLPAELAARRQQYEYYRDKLLTFKELEAAS